jgi:hypothetical protein
MKAAVRAVGFTPYNLLDAQTAARAFLQIVGETICLLAGR